jgi:hypothetical protein
MLQSGSVLANWDRNVITYSVAVRACEKGEQRRPALGLLEVMQQSGVVPKVITYNAAVSAFEKGEQWQQAFGLSALSRGPARVAAVAADAWSLAMMQQSSVVPDVQLLVVVRRVNTDIRHLVSCQ